MSELNRSDLFTAIRFLPGAVRQIIKDHNLCVAGGYLRSTVLGDKPNDIDIFSPTPEVAATAADHLMRVWTLDGRKIRQGRSKNALTLVGDGCCVQFITRWTYEKPVDVVASFDFTMCQAAVWWDATGSGSWRSATCPTYYQDVASRRLVYTIPVRNEDAGGSMLRVRKFLNLGWHIDAEQFGAVLARLVSRVEISKQMMEAPVEEREAWLSKVITSLLREVDPNLRIDGLEDLKGIEDAERAETREDFLAIKLETTRGEQL